jgi:hypothetical protein
MGSSQFDSWLASEIALDVQEEAWGGYLAQQVADDDARLYADPAYHAWVDQQARQYAAVAGGETY